MNTNANKLLRGGITFLESLLNDIRNAKESVAIQTMSFEADSVGCAVIEALNESAAKEKILLMDDYSRVVVNDKFVFFPFPSREHKKARAESRKLIPLLKEGEKRGLKWTFTRPMKYRPWKYPLRNHKKMVLIDNSISYLGGINLTEHNIRWDDLMVRYENRSLNDELWKLLRADLENRGETQSVNVDQHTVLGNWTSGNSSPIIDPLKDRIASARKLRLFSPYISWPMLDSVVQVSDHILLQPAENNKPWIHKLHRVPRYKNLVRREIPGLMNHMKFMIVDDKEVIFGSSNFDAISIFFEDEIIVQTTEEGLVSSFIELFEDLQL